MIQIIVMTELLAVLLTVYSWPSSFFWIRLGLTSLFVLWVALISLFLVCWVHRIASIHPAIFVWISFAIVVSMTAILSWVVGQFGGVISPTRDLNPTWAWILRNTIISGIVAAIAFRYFYLLHAWRISMEKRAAFQLSALQARIRPHFLFNSLNSIAALIRLQPNQAEQAIESLAHLFRSSVNHHKASTLQEEIELCKDYLKLEKIRLGDRLTISWSVDSSINQDIYVPHLVLQPIIENAIHHGIQNIPSGGWISIRLEGLERNYLKVVVENSRPDLIKDAFTVNQGRGMALDNIQERLTLLSETMNIREMPRIKVELLERTCRVCLWIPILDRIFYESLDR